MHIAIGGEFSCFLSFRLGMYTVAAKYSGLIGATLCNRGLRDPRCQTPKAEKLGAGLRSIG